MKGFQITKGKANISETFGITQEKADEMRAILLTAFYLHNIDIFKAKEGMLKNDTYEYVSQKLIDELDQTNIGEILYAGTKLGEFTEDMYKGQAEAILRMVYDYANGSTDGATIVAALKKVLMHK